MRALPRGKPPLDYVSTANQFEKTREDAVLFKLADYNISRGRVL
jgi:hypothetical protein